MANAYVISLFATSIVTYVIFYFCNKRCSSAAGDRGGGSIHVVVQGDGLNAAAVSTLPLCTFAQLKPYKVGSAAAASGCAVCLGDFEDGESVRVLPECCHAFHRRCIDPWLKIHDTCPTCRNSTLPVAAATPLAAAPPAPVPINTFSRVLLGDFLLLFSLILLIVW